MTSVSQVGMGTSSQLLVGNLDWCVRILPEPSAKRKRFTFVGNRHFTQRLTDASDQHVTKNNASPTASEFGSGKPPTIAWNPRPSAGVCLWCVARRPGLGNVPSPGRRCANSHSGEQPGTG